jgi:hypothetical protein
MLFKQQDYSFELSFVLCCCEKSDRTVKQSQTVAIFTLRQATNVPTLRQAAIAIILDRYLTGLNIMCHLSSQVNYIRCELKVSYPKFVSRKP